MLKLQAAIKYGEEDLQGAKVSVAMTSTCTVLFFIVIVSGPLHHKSSKPGFNLYYNKVQI